LSDPRLAAETAPFAKNKTEPALIFTSPVKTTEKDSGPLTASEVTQLQMDAEWVAMSACNTAAGDGENAERSGGRQNLPPIEHDNDLHVLMPVHARRRGCLYRTSRDVAPKASVAPNPQTRA
jgi:CHAT domain